MNTEEEWLSEEETMTILNIKETSLRMYRCTFKIKSKRVGKEYFYLKSSVDAYKKRVAEAVRIRRATNKF